MGNIRISKRIALALTLLVIVPNAVLLMLLEGGQVDNAEGLLLRYTLFLLVLLFPISKGIAYLIVVKDINSINKLFKNVRRGDYSGHFTLPTEKEDEGTILALKRHANWMMHAVMERESTLHSKLSEEATNRQELERISYIDSLTQIHNRRYFDENFDNLIEASQAGSQSISLILIDCDHFKEVNDTHGHQAGDEILQLLGSILKQVVRMDVDCPFRYGGDEFGVVINGASSKRAVEAAESIRSAFAAAGKYNTTLSIGVCHVSPTLITSIDADSLKSFADEALYVSKNEGKNKVSIKII